jgi:hypothetical protein
MRSRWVACAVVAVVAVIAGVGQAFLWSAIAPRQRWIVYRPDPSRFPDGHNFASLPTENVDRFTAIGMFAMMSLVIGVVIGTAAWQIRFARGLSMLLSAGSGCAVGSSVALWLGSRLSGGVLPAVLAKQGVDHDQIVTMPPGISWTSLVIAPLFAVAVYTVIAAWHPEPGLGGAPRRQPEEPVTVHITSVGHSPAN